MMKKNLAILISFLVFSFCGFGVFGNDEKILNPEGFRYIDECVRHKMLDVLGDLALAGAPIVGAYKGIRSGHSITNQLLKKLFSDSSAFEMSICSDETAAILPGVGVVKEDLPKS